MTQVTQAKEWLSTLRSSLFLLVALLAAACITINVHFPARQVENAAEEIVDDVRSVEGETGAGAGAEVPSTSGLLLVPHFLMKTAYAQEKKSEVKIEIDSPVIKAIRANLKKRFAKLLPGYNGGAIGEKLDGYLETRQMDKLGLKEKRDLKALVEAENRDRKNLYQAIVKANNFGKERLKDVQTIFAKQWIEKSRTGWWIQDEKGKWIKKPKPKPKPNKKK